MGVNPVRPGLSVNPESAGRIAVLSPQRERLAIVSTRHKLCGIAAYTAALERQLADIFEITVFDLDQYLLRGKHHRVRALGDRHIKEICRELADFDVVYLQLEYGTLGITWQDIYRRFAWLVAAAPRLSVTLHSLKRPATFDFTEFATSIIKFNWGSAFDVAVSFSYDRKLSLGIARQLRRMQRRKPVSVIVHNRRDRADAQHLHGLDRVFARRRFPTLDRLPADTVLIGIFGFLNDYKGFGSVIRSLHHIPETYHLSIFGGTHPNEILVNQSIHPYIASLHREGNVDATLYDQILASPNRNGISLALDIERQITDLLSSHPRDLSHRIHFMGALEDNDFLTGMAICDAVVFPYLEVGQSASGPISQAVELGCRIIASRTHTFLQFATYHPNTIEFFDIGNHLELAERITSRLYARREASRYNIETNKAVYFAANSAPDATSQRFRRRSKPLLPGREVEIA
jgi:glycosyltransferase involved in cell wall biosynthesis